MKLSGPAQAELIKVAAIGLAVVAAVYFIRKGVTQVADAVQDKYGSSAGEIVGGVLSDTAAMPVLFIGDALGVPRTEPGKCSQAKRTGDTWGAAAYCPAADWISWVTGGRKQGGASGTW